MSFEYNQRVHDRSNYRARAHSLKLCKSVESFVELPVQMAFVADNFFQRNAVRQRREMIQARAKGARDLQQKRARRFELPTFSLGS